tara:strand:+ start:245 stop:430 length:186 start_codon:yes stop_codon:yes gene_type:complete
MKTLKVKTNQVKKGDKFSRGINSSVAYSDSYLHNGVWSVDIGDGFIYGWQSRVTEITIERK